MKIELGDEVKDTITGFIGVVICVSTWLNGCDRVVVQPRKLSKDGHIPITESFDVTQLEILNKKVIKVPNSEVEVSKRTGGPRPNPKRY